MYSQHVLTSNTNHLFHNAHAPLDTPTRHASTTASTILNATPTIYTQNGHSYETYDCTHNIHDYVVGAALARSECVVHAAAHIVGNTAHVL